MLVYEWIEGINDERNSELKKKKINVKSKPQGI